MGTTAKPEGSTPGAAPRLGPVQRAVTLLAAWNIALLAALFAMLPLGRLVAGFVGSISLWSPAFWFVLMSALAVGGAVGFVGAVKLRHFFASLSWQWSSVWLAGLLALTALSFPGRFFYVLDGG